MGGRIASGIDDAELVHCYYMAFPQMWEVYAEQPNDAAARVGKRIQVQEGAIGCLESLGLEVGFPPRYKLSIAGGS